MDILLEVVLARSEVIIGSPELSKYVDGSLGAMDTKLLAISPTEVIELLESASKA